MIFHYCLYYVNILLFSHLFFTLHMTPFITSYAITFDADAGYYAPLFETPSAEPAIRDDAVTR